MADQNNNVVGPSDYFKLIINEKNKSRVINKQSYRRGVGCTSWDYQGELPWIDTKEGNEVEPSVTFEVLKSRPVKTRNAKQTKKKK